MLLVVVAVVGLVAVFGILVALVARRSATNKERAIGLSLCIVFFLLTACTEIVLVRSSRASVASEVVADVQSKPATHTYRRSSGPTDEPHTPRHADPEFVKRYRKDGKLTWATAKAKTDPLDDAPLLPLGMTPPKPAKVIQKEDDTGNDSSDDSRDEPVRKHRPIHHPTVEGYPKRQTPKSPPAAEATNTPPPNPRREGS
jgi:hypothetical protein